MAPNSHGFAKCSPHLPENGKHPLCWCYWELPICIPWWPYRCLKRLSHLKKLSLVFQKLTQAGLKVKLTKCEFFKSRIELLLHLVDGDGIHTMDSKITAVKNFLTPKSVENVRSFLGLVGYYRAFVKNFASIASPLTRFLKRKMYLLSGMMLSNRVSIPLRMLLLVHPSLHFQNTHCHLPYVQTPLL